MAERYPDDATLLGLERDQATGVEYIPTGLSPYYLAFRRMLYRLLQAASRANDLRVYEAGDLEVGVRPGCCFVDDGPIEFEGIEAVPIDAGQVTCVWMSSAGVVETGSAWPEGWGTYVPLAKVQADSQGIEAIQDRRGQAFLNALSLKGLGVSASGAELSQALDGIESSVTAEALNSLCDGGMSDADGLHQHTQMLKVEDNRATFALINSGTGVNAGVALRFDVTSWAPAPVFLELDTEAGYLHQRQGEAGAGYALVGSTHVQGRHEGELSEDQDGVLCGLVPVEGEIESVVVSVGQNIESSEGDDGVVAQVKVNGAALCDTDPAIASDAGAGFRSTDQGDGEAAAVKSDGTEQVQRGDLVTVDFKYAEAGNVSVPMRDVAVLVSVRAKKPV